LRVAVDAFPAHDLEAGTIRKVAYRIVPFLMLCYFFNLLDRINLGFAALEMNKDLAESHRPLSRGFYRSRGIYPYLHEPHRDGRCQSFS